MLRVLVRRNSPTAILPKKSEPDAAGYDICADLGLGGEVTLYPGTRKLFPTGLSMAFEPGWYMRIAPRSGLAYKSGIDVLAGVVDPSYRGDIGVILLNTGTVPLTIKHGDKIAQAIFESYADAEFEETADLPESQRGEGGFGSTGR
ncbi:dUTP diphosphatase [Pseudaminobacter sp. 19-2017]|uniref:dUTP diphosphatase n=1 Tax=Pseudaminobacter soli (ex Zhang et al. 2022) TaxID=2831468 RepID=A0A942E049_9HYPH|nr:dUTP diphosphatase [Pseudaminobacter soli]MBS3648713.1 dUTP diphosphatase [Pseudaminobacter soli]